MSRGGPGQVTPYPLGNSYRAGPPTQNIFNTVYSLLLQWSAAWCRAETGIAGNEPETKIKVNSGFLLLLGLAPGQAGRRRGLGDRQVA